eukprot:8839850-Pyramimonas_sp.AAC.1
MIKTWDKSDGNPLLWLEVWARDRLLSHSDGSYIEMKCLLAAICYTGTYDQVNLASMASIGVLCRRVSTIVEAYSGDPTRPNRGPEWAGLKHFMGTTSPLDIVDPTLRTT